MTVPHDRRTFLLGTAVFGAVSACSSGGGSKSATAETAGVAKDSFPVSEAELKVGVQVVRFDLPTGNVGRYGAVGNGIVDDSAAIEAAVAVTRGSSGGTVRLPPGTYRIARTIMDRGGRAPVTLQGDDATLLLGDANGPALRITADDFTLSDLRLAAAAGITAIGAPFGLPPAAIEAGGCSRLTLRRCRFERLPHMGLLIRADLSGAADVQIESCVFVELRATAVRLNGLDPAASLERVRIDGCTFAAPSDPVSAQTRAIHVGGRVSDVRILGNAFSGEGSLDYSRGWRDTIMVGDGTAVGQPSRILIANNVIAGMADDGIGLAGAADVTIVGNVITGSPVTAGIYAPANGTWRNTNVTIAANQLVRNHIAGIFLKDTDGYAITGNLIEDSRAGIVVLDAGTAPSTHGTIASNTLRRLRTTAIHCASTLATVTGNLIDGYAQDVGGDAAERAGILMRGRGGAAVVSGNQFTNGHHGVVVTGAYSRFTMNGNLGDGLAGFGLLLIEFVGDRWIVTSNQLTGALGHAAGLPPSPPGIFADNL
ncbi:MAG: hypothetical protein EHM60_03715 [Lysobacterales bacterium]|jgi:nitrous oxidase accessory protein NosD|nr:MAG: hypothetical protein EHM60_03715 [Xanthomonadales bacterium]